MYILKVFKYTQINNLNFQQSENIKVLIIYLIINIRKEKQLFSLLNKVKFLTIKLNETDQKWVLSVSLSISVSVCPSFFLPVFWMKGLWENSTIHLLRDIKLFQNKSWIQKKY